MVYGELWRRDNVLLAAEDVVLVQPDRDSGEPVVGWSDEYVQKQTLIGGGKAMLTVVSVALPAQVDEILDTIRLASNWMFGLFLAGAVVSFVMIFIVPLAVYSRWASLPITIGTFIAALTTTVRSPPHPPPPYTHNPPLTHSLFPHRPPQ